MEEGRREEQRRSGKDRRRIKEVRGGKWTGRGGGNGKGLDSQLQLPDHVSHVNHFKLAPNAPSSRWAIFERVRVMSLHMTNI